VTERHVGYIVTLASDVREDEAGLIINALRMISGVATVEPVVTDVEAVMARARVQSKVSRNLHEAIDKILREVDLG